MFYSSFPRVALAHAYARCRDTSAKCARRCTFTCRFLTGTSGAARDRECDKLGLAEWPVLALRVIVKALIIFISLKILLKRASHTLKHSVTQSVSQSIRVTAHVQHRPSKHDLPLFLVVFFRIIFTALLFMDVLGLAS